SDLLIDRISTHQNNTGKREGGTTARGKDGDSRQERIDSCAPDCLGDIAAKEYCQETLRRHRTEIDGAQRRLHAHCEARPTQERLRSDGVHRVGGCSTRHRGKTGGRKEGETERSGANRKTKGTRAETRRTSDETRGTDGAAGGRTEAEKAEMVQPKIGGAGEIIAVASGLARNALWFSDAVTSSSGPLSLFRVCRCMIGSASHDA